MLMLILIVSRSVAADSARDHHYTSILCIYIYMYVCMYVCMYIDLASVSSSSMIIIILVIISLITIVYFYCQY